MKIIENTLFVVSIFFGIFFLGPEIESPNMELPLPKIPSSLYELENWINTQEAAFDNIKPDNASQLEFYDSIPQKQIIVYFICMAFLPVRKRVIQYTEILPVR